MKNCKKPVSSLLFAVGALLAIAVPAAQAAANTAEAQQLHEDMSPLGQYKLAQKEVNAAYQQALSDCRKMSKSDRAACMKEAKSQHQSDLAEAKKTYNSRK